MWRPFLDVIGSGTHRLSEIAGRLGQPATSLTRPIARLQELGLVRRQTPFGLPERSSKKALSTIDDPFVRLWARVAAPHRSMLATATRAGPAQRHWKGNDPEFDVVAESSDGQRLLLGEVKWSDAPVTAADLQATYRRLVAKGVPGDVNVIGREIDYAIFVPATARPAKPGAAYTVVTAVEVMESLRE